jgi:hypothetical protein
MLQKSRIYYANPCKNVLNNLSIFLTKIVLYFLYFISVWYVLLCIHNYCFLIISFGHFEICIVVELFSNVMFSVFLASFSYLFRSENKYILFSPATYVYCLSCNVQIVKNSCQILLMVVPYTSGKIWSALFNFLFFWQCVWIYPL